MIYNFFYDKGDIVGCGYSKEHDIIYFTKNGNHLHSIYNFPDIKYYPIMTFKLDYNQKASEVLLLEPSEFMFKNEEFLKGETEKIERDIEAVDGVGNDDVLTGGVDNFGSSNTLEDDLFNTILPGVRPGSPWM